MTYGIPADKVASISGSDIPNNLYYEISQREERVAKSAETILYDTSDLCPTEMLYITEPDSHTFSAKVVEILPNLTKPQP